MKEKTPSQKREKMNPPGKRTTEELQDQRIPDESPEEEKAKHSIIEKFKLGLKKSCAKQIWESVQVRVAELLGVKNDEVSQQEVADYLGVPRPAVTKGLNNGQLSLENLVVFLTQLELGWGDLPDLPDLKTRCLAGYQEALSWICNNERTIGGDELVSEAEAGEGRKQTREDLVSITKEEFLSLCPVLSDWEYYSSEASGTLDERTWERILLRQRPIMAKLLGLTVARLPYNSPTALDILRRRCGKAVARCLHAIPYNWLERDA